MEVFAIGYYFISQLNCIGEAALLPRNSPDTHARLPLHSLTLGINSPVQTVWTGESQSIASHCCSSYQFSFTLYHHMVVFLCLLGVVLWASLSVCIGYSIAEEDICHHALCQCMLAVIISPRYVF